MKFDHAKMSEILLTVEKNFDVNRINYKGCHLWPMIRILMYFQMLNYKDPVPVTNKSTTKAKRKLKNFLRRPFRLLTFFKDYVVYVFYQLVHVLTKKEEKTCIFITREEDRKSLFSEERLNPFYFSTQKLFPNTNIHEYCAEDLLAIKHRLISPFRIRSITRDALNQKKAISEVCQYTNSLFPDFTFGAIAYVWFLFEILIYREIYRVMFKRNKVNTVFTTVYYSSSSMAAAWACNEMGIDVVEIQHGQQGKISPLNNDWTKLPKAGYLLMPKFFWVWGNLTLNRKRVFRNHEFHQIFVGGNPNLSISTRSNVKSGTHKPIHVLFAMQPIQHPLPQFLLDLISELHESEVIWHIRLHPRMIDRLTEVEELFANSPNVEIRISTQTPLYLLLPQINKVLTLWSTVVYEACFFHIPACILSANGKNLMKDHIDSGLLHYAGNRESLRSFILSQSSKSFPDLKDFIETDHAQIKQNIEKALPQLEYKEPLDQFGQ